MTYSIEIFRMETISGKVRLMSDVRVEIKVENIKHFIQYRNIHYKYRIRIETISGTLWLAHLH